MNFDSNTPDNSASANQWLAPAETKAAPSKPVSSRLREKAADEAGEKLAAEMKVFNQVATELKAKRSADLSIASRRKLVVETATELFGLAPTWTAFYRETLGGDGVARALFADVDE
ncbi:MAG: hypothetical protein ACOVLE_05265, partial [Pirellula staleyi]